MSAPMTPGERLERFYATLERLDANLKRTRRLIDWSEQMLHEAQQRLRERALNHDRSDPTERQSLWGQFGRS